MVHKNLILKYIEQNDARSLIIKNYIKIINNFKDM